MSDQCEGEVEASAPSFEDRVEQLCDLFRSAKEISSLRNFLVARETQRKAGTASVADILTRRERADNDESGLAIGAAAHERAIIPDALLASDLDNIDEHVHLLVVYRAWAFIFREALAVKHANLLDELVAWLDEFSYNSPAASPLGGVEVIRVYASLRTGLQSKGLSRQSQVMAFDILARLPLSPILPLMQTSLSALDVEDIITSAMNRHRRGKGMQIGSADITSAIRTLTYDENPITLGTYDKKLLVLKLKDRASRSESFMAIMAYLQSLERESSLVVSIETRFKALSKVLTRQAASFPPSLATAYTLFREAINLSLSASEFPYPASFHSEVANLVDEMRVNLDRALEASKAANLQKLSLHHVSKTARASRNSGNRGSSSGQRSSFADSESASRLLSHLGSSQMMRSSSISSRNLVAGRPSGGSRIASFTRDPTALLSSATALSAAEHAVGGFANAPGSPSSRIASSPLNVAAASAEAGSNADPAAAAAAAAAVGGAGGPAGMDAEGRKEAQRKNKPTVTDFDPARFYLAPQGTKVAEVPKIWLQVDTNPESIAMTQPDLVGEDEMTSQNFGTFRMYKNRMTWVMMNPSALSSMRSATISDSESVLTSSTGREGEATNNLGTKLYDVGRNHADPAEDTVKSHAAGDACADEDLCSGGVAARVRHVSTPIARAFHRLLTSVLQNETGSQRMLFQQESEVEDQVANRRNEIAASLYTIPTSAIKRFTFGPLDSTRSYLAIYTLTEVIKLFPFSRREITQLASALNEFTGLKATSVGSQTSFSIQRKMDNIRRRLQDSINGNWIDHTEELHRVLINITKDNTPIRMRDLERVYHSARHNKTIVRECIPILQEIWRCSKGQDSMLKVLAVVDRILDGDILHGDDPVLARMLQWLHQIETGLDPYSHSRPLKLLLKVCHRAEYLQTQTILPLIETFYDDEVFVMPKVYNMYLRTHDK